MAVNTETEIDTIHGMDEAHSSVGGIESSMGCPDPPWCGWIETTGDALLILEAARRGIIPRVTRRLVETERKMINSGSVFVFDEDESGIKRWTDGYYWSPSRILGNFLLYRETDKRGSNRGQKKSEVAARAESVASTSPPHDQEIEQLYDPNNKTGTFHILSRPKNEPTINGMDRNRERTLVGSLTNSYKFKPNGMMKKTFSLTIGGVSQHLISYYRIEDVESGKLRCPSTYPELTSLEISRDYLDKTHFRCPPKIEYDQDGKPHYAGEGESNEVDKGLHGGLVDGMEGMNDALPPLRKKRGNSQSAMIPTGYVEPRRKRARTAESPPPPGGVNGGGTMNQQNIHLPPPHQIHPGMGMSAPPPPLAIPPMYGHPSHHPPPHIPPLLSPDSHSHSQNQPQQQHSHTQQSSPHPSLQATAPASGGYYPHYAPPYMYAGYAHMPPVPTAPSPSPSSYSSSFGMGYNHYPPHLQMGIPPLTVPMSTSNSSSSQGHPNSHQQSPVQHHPQHPGLVSSSSAGSLAESHSSQSQSQDSQSPAMTPTHTHTLSRTHSSPQSQHPSHTSSGLHSHQQSQHQSHQSQSQAQPNSHPQSPHTQSPTHPAMYSYTQSYPPYYSGYHHMPSPHTQLPSPIQSLPQSSQMSNSHSGHGSSQGSPMGSLGLGLNGNVGAGAGQGHQAKGRRTRNSREGEE